MEDQSVVRLKLPELPAWVVMPPDEELDLVGNREAMERLDQCGTCGGAQEGQDATFKWWTDGACTGVSEWECDCAQQFILRRWLRVRGVGGRVARLPAMAISMSPLLASGPMLDLVRGDEGDPFGPARRFIRSGEGVVVTGSAAACFGVMGVVMKRLMRGGFKVHQISAADFVDTTAASWKNDAMREWLDRRVRSAEVLYLSDVSASGMPSHGERTMANLLRSRTNDGRTTIVSTTMQPADFEAKFGVSIPLLGTALRAGENDDKLVPAWQAKMRQEGLTAPVMFDRWW